ncbi:HD domain-containing protein [Phytohabitans aurantiacus]|uniref:Hydrolase n=1 Tax=Phytohabitans aurantiacus TaxID=3016789 RepID=A0ABQ5R0V9_9ACTN|nr:HD domain-containing protein [Phytohabitans aurantiacus]GLH99811.1 hydrolase [Phytohabitans aurantiacus]
MSESTQSSAVELPEELRFVLDLDALKDLERQNPLTVGSRRERVAEHSWHVAIAALLLQDFADEDIDLGHAVLLAVVHDVVERFVGDTFAFGDGKAGQHEREHTAMKRLRESTDAKAIQRLVDCWQEYEAQETATARFVKGLDALLPIAQNFSNPEQSSWVAHRVAAEKVRTRLRSHGAAGRLREIAEQMISSAQARGYLT